MATKSLAIVPVVPTLSVEEDERVQRAAAEFLIEKVMPFIKATQQTRSVVLIRDACEDLVDAAQDLDDAVYAVLAPHLESLDALETFVTHTMSRRRE